MAGQRLGERFCFCSGLMGFLLWKEMLRHYDNSYNKLIFGSRTRLSVQPSQHCVTTYGNRVTFGGGTQLRINPNVTPSPSVYRLVSKDDEDLEMCLITDYSPEKLTLNQAVNKTNAIVEVATSDNKQEASYVSTYWAKKDEMQCSANHEGFGELEGEDPESGVSAVCVTGIAQHFRTDENLNMLSLSQLGLKMILMKGIIFNVLMTMLMWKKKNESNQMVQS